MKICQYCGKELYGSDKCTYCHTDPTTGMPPKSKLSSAEIVVLLVGIAFVAFAAVIFVSYLSDGLSPDPAIITCCLIGCLIIYFALKRHMRDRSLHTLAQKNPKEYKRQITELREKEEARVKKQEAEHQVKLAQLPACPICGSKEHVERITNTDRTVDAAVWGLSASSIGKQYTCSKCRHAFNVNAVVSTAQTIGDDPIEEIRKYKQLLDDGIISQEEFDKKKSQLLKL